jgi:hypothetical protein
MDTYEDKYHRDFVRGINIARAQGKVVAIEKWESYQLPVAGIPLVTDIPGARRIYEYPYRYDSDWGRLRYEHDYRALVLDDAPPEGVAFPTIQVVEATIYPGSVVVHADPELTLDMPTNIYVHDLWKRVNQAIYQDGLPVFVWKVAPDSGPGSDLEVIRIFNDDALVFASCAVWSPDTEQLVAAQLVSTSMETLTAIRATLAKNNNKAQITVQCSSAGRVTLKGAKRGFLKVANSLAKVNAAGIVTAILHPLAVGNPAETADDHFYVVAAPDDDLTHLFGERLTLALTWPTQPAWAAHLLEAGMEAGLVKLLPKAGDGFKAAAWVKKDGLSWMQLIAAGLQSGAITIQ